MTNLFFNEGRRRLISLPTFFLLIILAFVGMVDARSYNPKIDRAAKNFSPPASGIETPVVLYTAHNRGNMQLAIANNGTFGTLGGATPDPFTGEIIPSCIFPKGSDIVYLWVAAIWIGAVVGRDTLVTVGNEDWYVTEEFNPDVRPFGDFKYLSIDRNSEFYDPDAYSEQDIICEYTDTIDDVNQVQKDPYDNRPHRPLNIKVTQRSMAWSYSYADDFILFDYQIENIGERPLEDVYMGIYVDGDVWHTTRNGPEGWNDDIVGFYPTHPAPEGCGFVDTINVAFTADNDGDPVGTQWDYRSATGTVGIRVVRTPAEELKYSYNWWIMNYSNATRDFGPRMVGTPEDPYRKMGARKGTPTGDENKYYVLRHEEFDYDLMHTALDHQNQGFEPPPEEAEDYAHGFDTRYLLSFGPFNIYPGNKLPISFAWVGGTNLHTGPTNFDNKFDAQNPQIFYNTLNFDSLAATSRWASWVYDNPGVDTDSDGYRGELRVCNYDSALVSADTFWDGDIIINIIEHYQPTLADTFWYVGDGVPDFKAAGPPPAPKMRIIPETGRLTIRWNGYYSETTRDIFSQVVDFEGYRVYVGRDDRRTSLSLLVSYDQEDFNRYIYKQVGNQSQWVLEEIPFTLDSLRTLFDDPEFDPMAYAPAHPFEWADELYIFAPQDLNAANLTDTTLIHKAYQDAADPGTNPTLWGEDDITYEHGEALPKYYEYEYHIGHLLPTVEYYVSVTTFDFGSPIAGLEALETDPTNNQISEYPLISADTVMAQSLDAYVYPNPYRIDDDYMESGYENRDRTLAEDRARLIHFTNLPNICTIKIYSLDGDLVREIEHYYPESGPGSMHETWDMITRNTQAAVSGLYYYVIESSNRTQLGKLVIIK